MNAPVDVWVRRRPNGGAPDRAAFLAEVVESYGLGPPRFDRTCRICGHPNHGKPRLVGSSDLDLSLAHAGSLVAVAVGRGRTVGVDVETRDRLRVDLRSAGGVFTGAESALVAQAEDWTLLTLALWTRKEAVVKAIGWGLAYPLNEVTVADPATPILEGEVFEVEVAADVFTVATLVLSGGEVLSIAVNAPWPGVRWRGQPACWPDAVRPSLAKASHKRA